MAGDLLHALADSGYHLHDPEQADATFLAQVRAVTGAYAHLGDDLARGAHEPTAAEPVSESALRAAALDWLGRWKDDLTAEKGAVAVVAAEEWMRSLAELAASLEPAVAKVVEAARVPWWR